MTVQVAYQLWRSKLNVAFHDRLEATNLSYITTCVICVSIRYQVFLQFNFYPNVTMFVRPTYGVEAFGNISSPLCALAIL